VASDLPRVSSLAYRKHSRVTHLSPSTIPTRYRCALPWCWLTEVHLGVLRISVGVMRIGRVRYMLRMSLIHVVRRVTVEILLLLSLRRR